MASLVGAVSAGNLKLVKQLVQNGAAGEANYGIWWGALLMAASITGGIPARTRLGHLDVVRVLEAKDERGWTALIMAAHLGNLEIVRYLVEQGADKEAKNNDGSTVLMHAAWSGHLEVVRHLDECGTDKEAKAKDGETALIRAAGMGHLAVVSYLVEQGADKDAEGNYGTALIAAAREGHLEVARYLVKQGADKAPKDKDGYSALTLAARRDHMEVVRYLVEQGENNDGEAALNVAARSGHLDVARADSSSSAKDEDPQDAARHRQPPSLPMASSDLGQVLVPRLQIPLSTALSDAERLARLMAEATPLCLHVSRRLSSLFAALQASPAVSAPVLAKFLWQTARLLDFLHQFGGKKLVTRLVCSRKILKQTRSLHRELDAVSDEFSDDWEPQWRNDRRALRQSWNTLRQDRTRLASELLDTASQVEAMVLLKCEKETFFAKYTPDELELLNAVFGYVARLSSAEVPRVPSWFIPPHEVDVAKTPFSSGAFGSVHHGTWLGARVVIKRMLAPVNSEMERGVFMNEVKIWFHLNYPHVVKLHGACHVGRPFFVCELASNGILTDFIAKEEREGRHVLWQKLYEAALGLQFLHERNVTHADLKGNNILVGADGTAKLTDFGLSSMLTSSAAPTPIAGAVGAVRWKAPEILSGASAASFAADIYSFGMSIIEAATHALPWGNQMPDAAVRYHVLESHALPRRPACLDDAQWGLIQSMCAFEPSKRLEIALVVQKLKHLAAKELNDSMDEGFGHLGENSSLYMSSSSERSAKSIYIYSSSSGAAQSRSSQGGDFSQSSGRALSSSTCSSNTLVEDDVAQGLELQKIMNPSLATRVETLVPSHSAAVQSAATPTVEVPDLKRVQVSPSRFVVCSNAASTVGATLRANGVYYAAARAIYVRQVRADTLGELSSHGQNLLAFAADDSTLSSLWSGSKIAELAKEEDFRVSFKIYVPCESSRQQLAPGMTVLLDLEHLSPSPSAEENLIVLRCLPSAGTIDTNTPTHHYACISDSGVRVSDVGYGDDVFLRGFRRGWYGDTYYRTVGDHPNQFLSGGDAGNSYRFNIRDEHDFGFDSKRLMIKLPDEGFVFCRGVGDNKKNPEMACVLFDSSGLVRDRYGYLGKLGRWNDIFQ